MKIYMQTNKATTNIFGLHTQPRKITRYTNKLKLAWGGGGGGGGGGRKKSPKFVQKTLALINSTFRERARAKKCKLWSTVFESAQNTNTGTVKIACGGIRNSVLSLSGELGKSQFLADEKEMNLSFKIF